MNYTSTRIELICGHKAVIKKKDRISELEDHQKKFLKLKHKKKKKKNNH
jgi:hypothetical protein